MRIKRLQVKTIYARKPFLIGTQKPENINVHLPISVKKVGYIIPTMNCYPMNI